MLLSGFSQFFLESMKIKILSTKSDQFTKRKIRGFVSGNFAECFRIASKCFKIASKCFIMPQNPSKCSKIASKLPQNASKCFKNPSKYFKTVSNLLQNCFKCYKVILQSLKSEIHRPNCFQKGFFVLKKRVFSGPKFCIFNIFYFDLIVFHILTQKGCSLSSAIHCNLHEKLFKGLKLVIISSFC